jgi:hypothetical protein
MFNLAAISDFLKDTLTESLKKPLQPSGLFAAAIFLLFNLLFAFPTLVDLNNPVATTFLGLSTAWQGVLASALVLVLAYLLVSMSSTILKLATGELWADSPWLGRMFTRRQKGILDALPTYDDCLEEASTQTQQLDDLEKKINESKATLKRLDKGSPDYRRKEAELARHKQDRNQLIAAILRCRQRSWEKTSRFSREEGYVAPTALGNVLNATASYIWQRYRIDMTALWPHMETVIADDTALVDRINNEKATLDFLLNLAFVFVVFSVEYLVVRLFYLGTWLQTFLVPLAALLLAFAFYRMAVGKARSWGQAVQMAFASDPHREKLRTTLGLRKFENSADERKVWKKASEWLLWGPMREDWVDSAAKYPYDDDYYLKKWPDDSIFDEPEKTTPPDASVDLHSDNAKVKLDTITSAHVEKRIPENSGQGAQTAMRYEEEISYIMVVSNADARQTTDGSDCMARARGVYLMVSDPRVLWIHEAPDLEEPKPGNNIYGQVACTLIPEDQPKSLLWRIDRLPPNSSCALRYRLPKPHFRATTNNPELKIQKESIIRRNNYVWYEFQLINEGNQPIKDATLEVFDTKIRLPQKPSALFLYIDDDYQIIENPEKLTKPEGYRWQFPALSSGARVTLEYTVTLG